ncbi:hypothetical protein HAX54_041873, partial [Datura stramonium]|nr:hypothetical protein [Datura stramonium]
IIMETQDKQNPSCSSSNIIPIANANEMPSQANEAIDEYCGARIKSTRNFGTSSMLDSIRRYCKKPSNLEIEDGSGGDDGSRPHYFDEDVSRRELTHAIILHEYPLSNVDHVGFRKLIASL